MSLEDAWSAAGCGLSGLGRGIQRQPSSNNIKTENDNFFKIKMGSSISATGDWGGGEWHPPSKSIGMGRGRVQDTSNKMIGEVRGLKFSQEAVTLHKQLRECKPALKKLEELICENNNLTEVFGFKYNFTSASDALEDINGILEVINGSDPTWDVGVLKQQLELSLEMIRANPEANALRCQYSSSHLPDDEDDDIKPLSDDFSFLPIFPKTGDTRSSAEIEEKSSSFSNFDLEGSTRSQEDQLTGIMNQPSGKLSQIPPDQLQALKRKQQDFFRNKITVNFQGMGRRIGDSSRAFLPILTKAAPTNTANSFKLNRLTPKSNTHQSQNTHQSIFGVYGQTQQNEIINRVEARHPDPPKAKKRSARDMIRETFNLNPIPIKSNPGDAEEAMSPLINTQPSRSARDMIRETFNLNPIPLRSNADASEEPMSPPINTQPSTNIAYEHFGNPNFEERNLSHDKSEGQWIWVPNTHSNSKTEPPKKIEAKKPNARGRPRKIQPVTMRTEKIRKITTRQQTIHKKAIARKSTGGKPRKKKYVVESDSDTKEQGGASSEEKRRNDEDFNNLIVNPGLGIIKMEVEINPAEYFQKEEPENMADERMEDEDSMNFYSQVIPLENAWKHVSTARRGRRKRN